MAKIEYHPKPRNSLYLCCFGYKTRNDSKQKSKHWFSWRRIRKTVPLQGSDVDLKSKAGEGSSERKEVQSCGCHVGVCGRFDIDDPGGSLMWHILHRRVVVPRPQPESGLSKAPIEFNHASVVQEQSHCGTLHS
ncbi:hypothetical protein RJT34_31728 [Clitoria ternatea]|uniref:Uncharacterized protein n=1 Tax=Clitoria ternatea TaxID=43366 RepID=A0AAN9EW20_CLITE